MRHLSRLCQLFFWGRPKFLFKWDWKEKEEWDCDPFSWIRDIHHEHRRPRCLWRLATVGISAHGETHRLWIQVPPKYILVPPAMCTMIFSGELHPGLGWRRLVNQADERSIPAVNPFWEYGESIKGVSYITIILVNNLVSTKNRRTFRAPPPQTQGEYLQWAKYSCKTVTLHT